MGRAASKREFFEVYKGKGKEKAMLGVSMSVGRMVDQSQRLNCLPKTFNIFTEGE